VRAGTVYRALLYCYPASFRAEYGREMQRTFDAELREARTAGALAGVGAWGRALRDLLPTAFREHRHVLTQDIRHALRVLRASPAFTAIAILSLALGIGANAAIFSLLNSVVLRVLPVPRPHELVIFTDPSAQGVAAGSQSGERSLATYDEFLDLQAARRTLAATFASSSSLQRARARVAGGEAEELSLRLVSASYFDVLGVPAAVGRVFAGRQEPAPGAAPHAVLSHDFWQRRFGGRSDAVGATLTFRDGVVQVIGVAPRGFTGETIGEQPDAWVPLAMQATVLPGRAWLHDRPGSFEKVMWLHVFGRLRDGVAVGEAQADANVVFRQGLVRYYGGIANETTRRSMLDQRLVARPAASGASALTDFADPLLVLLGASALVLLIACANLGNLLLARATARQREVAVRLALGAGRARLVRQLLTESLCLAAAGGVVGFVTSLVLREGLLRLLPDVVTLPVAIDWRVSAFIIAVTIVAGLALGVLPALRVTKTPMATGLRDQGRGIAGSAAWQRVGRAVVVGQLALSLPLLVGAGLLARTLINLQRVDLGYPREGLLTVRLDVEAAGYAPIPLSEALSALLARVRTIPGVAAAALSNNGLFAGSDNSDALEVEGYTRSGTGNADRGSRYDAVGPGYFSTLGVPVILGREIVESDRAGGARVAVINEAFAKQFFAGRNPIGRHLTQSYGEERNTYQIVGVAGDSRQNRLRGPIEHRFYTPMTQPAAAIGSAVLMVRPRGDGAAVLGEVRRLIQQAEPRMTIVAAGSVDESIARRIGQDRMMAQLAIAFGLIAGLLAAIGLYGILAYGVARRTPEIGLRKALGAGQGALMAMILRETAWLLLAGLIVGGALSAAAVQYIASRLYGLSPADPATFAAAVGILAAVAALAAWLPAWRASRVDPLIALRQQ
jgi:predicted permease